jgi:hypothetical protein
MVLRHYSVRALVRCFPSSTARALQQHKLVQYAANCDTTNQGALLEMRRREALHTLRRIEELVPIN